MAQGTLWIQPINTVFRAGVFVPGAKAYFYLAGSTTPVNVFSDVTLTTAYTQPVVADSSNGSFPEIFLTPGTAYKVDVQTSAGVSLQGYPADNQLAIPASAATVDTTETAGEALPAGSPVYLSDGTGGKNAGQLYLTDSANTYSSTLPLVGMVPSAIAQGATGTFRQAGQVTGLSSLTPGADYFLSTSGAITTSAPTNVRYLGRADSATSLIVAANPGLAKNLPTLTANDLVKGGGASALPSSWGTQAANTIVAGPVSGSAAIVTSRAVDPLDLGPLNFVTTAQFDKTDTTLATITGLSVTLVAGKTYTFTANLPLTTDVTGGSKFGFGGTATATYFQNTWVWTFNGASPVLDRSTALATTTNNSGIAATSNMTMTGEIVVNGAGTFTITFAQASASGTSSVLRGGWLRVNC